MVIYCLIASHQLQCEMPMQHRRPEHLSQARSLMGLGGAIRSINLTPHAIKLNDGRVFDPSGTIARVTSSFTDFDANGVARQVFGDVQNLPAATDGTMYIVSALVLGALNGSRSDVVAPATGHTDTIRNDKGHIVSVPGFVR